MCIIIKLIDARANESPIPLMELIRELKKTQVGDVVHLLSDDPGSARDIPTWVKKMGHELLYMQKGKNYWKIAVRKGR